MIIRDRIYGDVAVNSGVILDLINSKPMQRLKGIGQFGIPDEYYHQANYSRYEHSLGVMLLLKKLGASEEEQIAGLLHDVSHTAFSHVIDWVVGDGKTEDYQDEQHTQYLNNSEIPRILEKHGYSVNRISDYHHFGLLERDSPDLCADRVDYSLREFPADVVKICVPALAVHEGRIVFANQEAAELFAKHFLKQQMEHWGGLEAVSRYRIFANALRRAIGAKVISMDDFWKDDDFVMNKLVKAKNPDVISELEVLRSKSLAGLKKGTTPVHKKFRHVDPHFLLNGKVVRLSSVSQDFADELEKAREANRRGILIPSIAEQI